MMIKNIFNTIFVRVLTSVINLLIAIIISRYLGAEVKGEQGLLLTTISLVHIVMCVIGLGAIMYLIPRIKYINLIIPSYLWAIIVSIICYFLLPFIQPNANEFYFDIVILTFILTIFNINISSLIAKEHIIAANTLSIVQILINIISLCVSIFIYKISTVESYLYSLYISYGITLIISYFSVFKVFSFSTQDLSLSSIVDGSKQLFKYGVYNQLDVFAQMLSFRYSYYVLSSYVGNKEVGIYSVAVSITESIWLISRSISTVQHARIVNTQSFEKNTQLTLQFIKAGSIVTIAALLVLIVIPNTMYTWIFGAEFTNINELIITLAPGIALFSASFMISGLFSGIGKQYINSIAAITGLVCTIAGAYILIPMYGIYGAGITASISYGITTLVKYFYFSKQAKLCFNDYMIHASDIAKYKYEIKELLKRIKS